MEIKAVTVDFWFFFPKTFHFSLFVIALPNILLLRFTNRCVRKSTWLATQDAVRHLYSLVSRFPRHVKVETPCSNLWHFSCRKNGHRFEKLGYTFSVKNLSTEQACRWKCRFKLTRKYRDLSIFLRIFRLNWSRNVLPRGRRDRYLLYRL